MFPKLIQIGDFFLPTYGLLVALAFLAALWMAGRLARLEGLDADNVTNLGVYAALAGLAGAKLLMIAFDWRRYAAHPAEIFSLSTLRVGRNLLWRTDRGAAGRHALHAPQAAPGPPDP